MLLLGEGDLQKPARYLKLSFQEISHTGDVQQLDKRDNGLIDSTLVNKLVIYALKLQIGTPLHDVCVQLDTVSSALYVISPNSRDCKPKSGTASSILPDNFELTATASQDIQTATGNIDYFNACSYHGTFDFKNSSTFQTNDTLLGVAYGDVSYAFGIYGTDSMTIGNAILHNTTFGVARDSSGGSIKVVGSSSWHEASRTSFYYMNIPLVMKEQGRLKKLCVHSI